MNGPHMVGNDEQYAAAMALVATRLRVPARVVIGARLPQRRHRQGQRRGRLGRAAHRRRHLARAAARRRTCPSRPPRRNDPAERAGRRAARALGDSATPTPSASPSPEPEPETDDPTQDGRLLVVPLALAAAPARAGRGRRRAGVQAAAPDPPPPCLPGVGEVRRGLAGARRPRPRPRPRGARPLVPPLAGRRARAARAAPRPDRGRRGLRVRLARRSRAPRPTGRRCSRYVEGSARRYRCGAAGWRRSTRRRCGGPDHRLDRVDDHLRLLELDVVTAVRHDLEGPVASTPRPVPAAPRCQMRSNRSMILGGRSLNGTSRVSEALEHDQRAVLEERPGRLEQRARLCVHARPSQVEVLGVQAGIVLERPELLLAPDAHRLRLAVAVAAAARPGTRALTRGATWLDQHDAGDVLAGARRCTTLNGQHGHRVARPARTDRRSPARSSVASRSATRSLLVRRAPVPAGLAPRPARS